MSEYESSLLGSLAKVESLDQLKATLPPALTEKLGEKETGVNKTIEMLISLTPFAPEPATFGEDAFNAIVAVDSETGEPLQEEERQKMLNVALEAGFIQRAESQRGNRYSVKANLQEAVKRAIGEE